MLDILVSLSVFSLTAMVALLLVQNRKLIKQNHVMAVRDRVAELVGSVLDPIIWRLEDTRRTLETRNFLWSTNDEAIAVSELPREHLHQFQANNEFYYPTPRLKVLEPLFAGSSLLFEKERFADFEQGKPGVLENLSQIQNQLDTLSIILRILAIDTVRFLNSEKPNLFANSVCITYVTHLTIAKLTMNTDDFDSFLDTFAVNQEFLEAKESWIAKKESILSAVGKSFSIWQKVDELNALCTRLASQVDKLLNEFNELRREYLRNYHIPGYLVDAHKERRMQSIKWRNENQCMNGKPV